MKFLSALTLPAVMATFAAAIDAVNAEVTIYNRPNYNGLQESFVPNQDECHSVLPCVPPFLPFFLPDRPPQAPRLPQFRYPNYNIS